MGEEVEDADYMARERVKTAILPFFSMSLLPLHLGRCLRRILVFVLDGLMMELQRRIIRFW